MHTGFIICALLATGVLWAADSVDYKVLATNKTSTMEMELNEAAKEGYSFQAVMGGQTSVGGSEVVVVMARTGGQAPRKLYALLATSKTSTMQKELQQMSDEGFVYKGQTVFSSTFGGKEIAVIMERQAGAPGKPIDYLVVATKKTSTLEKELQAAGAQGYTLAGLTVGNTAFGGAETLAILWRERK